MLQSFLVCLTGWREVTSYTRSTQEAKQPISLTISEADGSAAGADIKLTAVLKNEWDHKIRVWWGEHYTVIINQMNGYQARHKPGVWGWGGSSADTTLGPGERLAEYPSLNDYDLVPGTYIVQVTRPLRRRRLSRKHHFEIE